MVGEIRDGETAEIAIKAAQTGHLVLSTLHTNSTVETLVRLEQMAIPRWMIASAVNIIVAQRLVRKLCPHCRTHHEPAILLPEHIWPSALPNWHAAGCERCYGGYYGRTALFEILPLSTDLKQAITQGEPASKIEMLAREQGDEYPFRKWLRCRRTRPYNVGRGLPCARCAKCLSLSSGTGRP
ncbi:Type II traffic warden ATPase [Cedecea neteri]|uniref:Type II traffic warden ATPase n=1 Tax=Cedecea neteri TaxID=158822 RepID=A0A2X2T4T4_9ENTR|nr:Type II traffic warden ATPase [Cedecea neteri]